MLRRGPAASAPSVLASHYGRWVRSWRRSVQRAHLSGSRRSPNRTSDCSTAWVRLRAELPLQLALLLSALDKWSHRRPTVRCGAMSHRCSRISRRQDLRRLQIVRGVLIATQQCAHLARPGTAQSSLPPWRRAEELTEHRLPTRKSKSDLIYACSRLFPQPLCCALSALAHPRSSR